MSSFYFVGGPANAIQEKLTSSTAKVIIDTTGATSGGSIQVARFEVNENAGSTPNLTVEVYNTLTSTSYYLGSGGVTWKAKAVTAYQSVAFNDGYVIPNGSQLRVTSSDAAGKFDVVGVKVGRSPGVGQ